MIEECISMKRKRDRTFKIRTFLGNLGYIIKIRNDF